MSEADILKTNSRRPSCMVAAGDNEAERVGSAESLDKATAGVF